MRQRCNFVLISSIDATSAVLRNCSEMENSSTGSPSSFEMARYWMNRCLKNHSGCPKPIPFLPTRVIDVGPVDGSQEPYLFEESLYQNTFPGEQRKYVALSHCWGSKPWFRTTADTIDERRSRISMPDLPKTFRDAVTVTRQLGVRYLWIDSLCIVQENTSDWEKEAVRMCDYYQNALCTITSAHSVNTRGGLFVQRDGIRIMPFEIEIQLLDKVVRCQFSPTPRREIVYDFQDLPLYKRAWVLQEMILSSRALIFDPDVVRWECLSGYGSERSLDAGIGRHHSRIRELQIGIAHLHNDQDVFDTFGDTISAKAIGWGHIVDDYMSRGLTNESDRLIAMAGVAKAMQRHTSDLYVAGLWKNLLPFSLAWHVRHVDDDILISNGPNIYVKDPPPYRSKNPISPSWSYTSVNVAVKYNLAIQEKPMCQIIDVRVEGPPQSQVGMITMHGDTRILYMMREKKSILSEALELSKSSKYKYAEEYGLKQMLIRPDHVVLASLEAPKWRSQAQAIPGNWYPDEIVSPETPVTFIAILQRPYLSGMPVGSRDQIVHTLALVPTGKAEGEYRRVGFASWANCSWYGFDCCEYRHNKAEPYARLAKTWGRVKPPVLAVSGTRQHPEKPHSIALEPMPSRTAYHTDVGIEQRTVKIV
jgi:hypothetical protein